MLIINSFTIYKSILFFVLFYAIYDVEIKANTENNVTISNLSETFDESTSSTMMTIASNTYKFVSFLCALLSNEQSSYFTELINKAFVPSTSVKLEIHVEIITNCADIYCKFIDCNTKYMKFMADNHQKINKPVSHLLMIGPFCEMSTSSSKFRDFMKHFFVDRPLDNLFMIFSTAFNFIPFSRDDYYYASGSTDKTGETSNHIAMMLHGNSLYYADGLWSLMTNYFQWKKFVLVRIIGTGQTEGFRDQSCSRIFDRLLWFQLNDNDFYVQEYAWYLKRDNTNEKIFKEIWLTIANVTRVILLCADITNVGKFLKQVAVDGSGNKYGLIVMKSTIDDADFFIESLNDSTVKAALSFVKIVTYEPPHCKEYDNTYKRNAVKDKMLSLDERHKMIKFDSFVGSYFCAVNSYMKFLTNQSTSTSTSSFHDNFIKQYQPDNKRVFTKENRLVIVLPVLLLHTYDYEKGQFVKALKINWANFSKPDFVELRKNKIKWHDEDEYLIDAPYCNNRSSFLKCVPQEGDANDIKMVGIITLISFAALVIILIGCCVCSCCIIFYSQMYLRRRWYLEPNVLIYNETAIASTKITTHFGMYKKAKIVVFDIETSLGLSGLQSKEVLQEIGRLARQTRTNSKFALFLGYSFVPPNVCKFVYELGRGASLMRILKSVKLAVELKFSLIRDLVIAMENVHQSFLHCHGDLRTDRCIIDERFMLRVAITRLPKFDTINRRSAPSKVNALHSSSLWTAPELIRNPNAVPTRASDVYSFAIILHEIVFQRGPFYVEEIHGQKHFNKLTASHFQTKLSTEKELKYDESCALVVIEQLKKTHLRPSLPFVRRTKTVKELDSLMIECWHECPGKRPMFNQIITKLQTYMSHEHLDIAFNTGKRLKTVSRNMMRELIMKKKKAISERDRALKYLTHLMPARFGYEFTLGHSSDLKPEYFENVTIYFNDLVEFSTMMQHYQSSYTTIVEILDELFEAYDKIVSFYDVVPLHRVGSCLLLASGVPHKNEMHALEIAQPALQIRQFAKSYQREKLGLRAGIHTGAVMSGIVGKNIPQFGVFGDTVNTASRMATTGEVNEIQVSEPVQKLLAQSSKCFIINSAGTKEVKGKGRMKLFWLKGYTTHPTIPLQRRLDALPCQRAIDLQLASNLAKPKITADLRVASNMVQTKSINLA